MEIIVLLIAVSLVLVALIGYAFFWAIESGQFEDLDAKGREILHDDDRITPGPESGSDDQSDR